MLELKTPKERADAAFRLAASFELIRYSSTLYQPEDFEEPGRAEALDPERTVWKPITREQLRRIAAHQFNILFSTDKELSSFEFMVGQYADHVDHVATDLLVRTPEGLRLLNSQGELVDVPGTFVPNTLAPVLNVDPAIKEEVFQTISDWVDGDDDARSLLSHLATTLAPGWSAVKYVLLLGEGRNGKSLLLRMLSTVIGTHNVSNVTRQNIAVQSPVVTDLNGKLLNLVFDGQAEYLKDSGAEKTLVAGELFPIRRLYDSTQTPVQTNALFVEGLQKEPKSTDKSTALQKRLVRFFFPNIYPIDRGFERKMLSPAYLGAFMSLLIDHYVLEEEIAQRLAPTQKALSLQLEHMHTNSFGLQFLKYLEGNSVLGAEELIGEPMDSAVAMFQSWRIKENDLNNWAAPDVASQLTLLFMTERKSARVGAKVQKVRVITGFKDEAQAFIDSTKGDDDEDSEALVGD